MAETFELFAVKYAGHQRTQAANYIDPPDPHEAMPMDYFVWAAVSGSRTFVIDTGFNAGEAAKRGRDFLRCPTDGLKAIGVDAGAVEDVIITHLHYDHAGTVGDFPKAKFYLQDREMAFATGRNMAHKTFNVAFALDYVVDMIAKVYDNRVVFVDGTMDVAPGVSVHHVGGHTDGLQIVRVWTERGWVVLASDAAHYYMNMETPNPFPLVYNIGDMLDAYQTMESLADGHANIVPGHDPLVLQRYPAPFRAAEGIVVRLNVDPVQ